MRDHLDFEPIKLFSSYMRLVDVPRLEDEISPEPQLQGKRLGLVNGSAWIQLWSYYFGRLFLPGVKLVNIGNEASQLNFMKAHYNREECPPKNNIEVFARYARDLVELADVDAILVTCSTMNRSLSAVKSAVSDYNIQVLQIDEPMMEKAVQIGGKVLVIATHGPTVRSTQQLLEEKCIKMGKSGNLQYTGATIEQAFDLLGKGNIEEHNRLIAQTIIDRIEKENLTQVVLAQLSMSVFSFSYPEPEKVFGIPVLMSGVEGFKRIKEILMSIKKDKK